MPTDAASKTGPSSGLVLDISDVEFMRFQTLVKTATGITLSDLKKALVVSRLGSRLRHRKARTFSEYYRIITDPEEGDELQAAIDLITTNETSFFREPIHFTVLRDHIRSLRPVPLPFRVWSAAASSGEEAYTIAMTLAETLGQAEWEVHGTDISTRVLERARKAVYPIERSTTIPKELLSRYCLKGHGHYEGMFLIDRKLRSRVGFSQANLCRPLPNLGLFDVVFLRNVLIYFAPSEKRMVVEAIASRMKPGGLLLIGHSETLTGLTDRFQAIQPTVYRVP
ncbi:chemotaxis protein methyltransferase [Geothrix limicola]|uniref:protein-glutamate O-methyltransferase n=1 Tax=Geothrix limicola TaxID=2927978 RepID=A0ABQ5QCE8_9BACT|nr:CheR family methyltransferase [Geothrix limicola]GLH71729.1 chemotaxis protein methyltransferase [Geothrix limicola]